MAAHDGSPAAEDIDPLYTMPPPASQRKTAGKRVSPASDQGRAVCDDKSHARFGEGGTGDPLMGDRPLLYHIGMKCLHWLIQRSRMFLAGDQKYLCLKKFGELRKMLTSQITDELHLVAQPVG